ncbi:MAG: 1-deoxy-D-xylulose-5-phosphate synthase [Candidatus Anoxychlamydiales bacterium]|nr:1-deoxy-D-xylulose-5-phosphate synthase [Candidatus Anoxychlamydiales bacterium]NGX35522.1 1-deoxy-D-xylulose-5-phosphate synthase [Candidatus Anoxychlamydiales bacterium]
MRNAFAETITKLASLDQRIVLLSGDIGNRLFDPFKKLFPNRFYNCGVAEANMTSVAAGLALSGLKPITYTIAPFNTTRCLEQIKIDICYHNAPVIIVGVGAGLSYASLGGSHQSCEDISFLRSLPNMNIVSPCDSYELIALLKEAVKIDKPLYFRMGKKNEPLIYDKIPNLKIGKGNIIKKGKDICIISYGPILHEALLAADILKEKEKINAQIISMHTIKPLDTDLLKDIFNNFSSVISIEEHSIIGGLGSSIAEWMIDSDIKNKRLLRIGTPDSFFSPIGSQTFVRKKLKIDAENIYYKITNHLKTYENTRCNIS